MAKYYACPDCLSDDNLIAEIQVWETVRIGTEFADGPELGILDTIESDGDMVKPETLYSLNCAECGWKEGVNWAVSWKRAHEHLVLREEES